MKTIKYCCRNEKLGSKAVYKGLKHEFPDLKQKKKDCLGNCKLCHKQCFVQIGKKNVVCAENADELYLQLKAIINQTREQKELTPV